MPELNFQITGVEAAERGVTPLLHFKLRIDTAGKAEAIQALLLNAQIQILCPQRKYSAVEKERLVELFGAPELWGRTLQNRLWAHSSASVGAFSESVAVTLPVACSADLNIASSKYFSALSEGDVGLLFLFSGSVFYAAKDGRLQVEPISWNKECVWRMPAHTWHELMERHYPNAAWLSLSRDVFERLHAFKRCQGIATWEQTMERLLACAAQAEPGPESAPTGTPEVVI